MQKVMNEAEQAQALADLIAPETWPPDTGALNPELFSGTFQELAEMLKSGAAKQDITAKAIQRGVIDKILTPNTAQTPDQETAERLASRWQLITAAELMQPAKPPTFLLGQMIRRPSLICFYGPPGNLKTMLGYDLAVCIAGGVPWLPHLASEPGQGGGYVGANTRALILDLDNGPGRLQERIGALARGHGLTRPPELTAISLPNPPLNLAKPDDTENVIAQARALGAGLILVDNLGTASGGADENSCEMIQVMANLRYITETTSAAVIVIHHTRKGLANGGREGDRLRGHSSIEAALDLAMLIEREGNDITVKSTKTRDNPVSPFLARWTYEDNEWGALDWAKIWHVQDIQQKQAIYKETAAIIPDILKELGHEPNQAELAGLLQAREGISRPTALEAISRAVKDGAVNETKAGGYRTAERRYSVRD